MSAGTSTARRRYRMWIAVLLVAILVGGITAAVVEYRKVHQPKGIEPTGLVPRPECQLDESTLDRVHTHNFLHGSVYGRAEYANSDPDFSAECQWGQSKGADGMDVRELNLYIGRYDEPRGVAYAEDRYAKSKTPPYRLSSPRVTDVSGIGDEATFSIQTSGTTSIAGLTVRQGNIIVGAQLRGENQGLLRSSPVSASEGQEILEVVVRDLLRRNPSHAP